MLAYHNDQKIKDALLAQLSAHEAADEIVKGQYWEDGKGCAVGCTIHSGHHQEYERRYGIPQVLAHLEDRIFEGLPNDLAKKWPKRFAGVIRPGADLSRVGWKFLHWLLTDKAVNPGIDHPLVKDAVSAVADLIFKLSIGEHLADGAAASAAWSAADSAERIAADSAESAAESAAWSAERAESAAESAAWSAESAALSAARGAARSAAWSAESAAWSAASAAWSAEGSATWSAERAAYVRMSDKLIELLAAA